MKKIVCLAIVLAVFANVNTFSATRKSSSSKKNSSGQSQVEPVKVVLQFLREYVRNSYDYDSYLESTPLVTDKFRAKYYKEQNDYLNLYGFLDVNLLLKSQDAPEEYKLVSYDANKNIVVVKEKYNDYPKLKFQVKNINGKWVVDNYFD